MIKRNKFLDEIREAFISHRVVCLIGPRQSGKTTIARQMKFEYANVHYFDFENPITLKKFDNPVQELSNLTGLIIIDEIQRKLDIFPYLRHLHDEYLDQKFLILGSASEILTKKASKSLSGRIIFIEITPFSIDEVNDVEKLFVFGGFPKSYLVDWNVSQVWLRNYRQSYINEGLDVLGEEYQIGLLEKLWIMTAHYHGQIISYSSIASTLKISESTTQKFISRYNENFMLRILNPWYDSIRKRRKQNPKVYYRDSGLLHSALSIQTYKQALQHSKAGAVFEGFALEEVIRAHSVEPRDCYFWSIPGVAELDLLILHNGRKLGFEFKMGDAPNLTKSMRMAFEELQLDSLTVISQKTGAKYMLADRISVISLEEYIKQQKK